jgi:hypothetical protein
LVRSKEWNGRDVVVVGYHEVNKKYRVLFTAGYTKNVESTHLQKSATPVEFGCYTHELERVCLFGQMPKEQKCEDNRPSEQKGLEAKAIKDQKEHRGLEGFFLEEGRSSTMAYQLLHVGVPTGFKKEEEAHMDWFVPGDLAVRHGLEIQAEMNGEEAVMSSAPTRVVATDSFAVRTWVFCSSPVVFKTR